MRMLAGRAPFAEFQLFGPDGDRTASERRFNGITFVDGEWRQKWVPGPANFTAWKASWAVFRAAMIALGAATADAV